MPTIFTIRPGASASLSRMNEDIDGLTRLEAVQMLQNVLVGFATGGGGDNSVYVGLRRRLLADAAVSGRLPSYVKTCLSLAQFWPTIQHEGGYAARRERLWADFGAIIGQLETSAPADTTVSDALKTLSAEEVQTIWARALERRASDPEAAITSARTLLESTCKHVLEEEGVCYDDKADLPKLYGLTAQTLNVAPDQHTERVFKQILGGCQAVVEGLGAMRNKLSDAHGKGRSAPKPATRHAELAVNLAGAMATFLVNTWSARRARETE